MKVVVYSSDNPVLRLALEEIKRKLEESKVLTDFDFMIIALNYRYPYENLDKNLRKIFGINSEDYFAFHATESFANINTTEGISVAFIKFENRGNRFNTGGCGNKGGQSCRGWQVLLWRIRYHY